MADRYSDGDGKRAYLFQAVKDLVRFVGIQKRQSAENRVSQWNHGSPAELFKTQCLGSCEKQILSILISSGL